MYPSLIVIHLPGRALWFCDILSRQYDNVIVKRTDTEISKEQATIIPSLKAIKPGNILQNNELLDLFATKFGPEELDKTVTLDTLKKLIGHCILIHTSILRQKESFSLEEF